MSGPSPVADAATRERLRALAERRLTPEEWAAYVGAPLTDDEREETLALVAWFTRRYPTPAERLAWARRAYRRWTAGAGFRTPRRGEGPAE